MVGEAPSSLKVVEAYFLELQARICGALESRDGQARFFSDPLEHPGGGRSLPMLLEGGPVFEKAAVNVSASRGASLPNAATEKRPEFVGCGFEAAAISLIVHPRNPYVPTTHANLRCFLAKRDGKPVDWWFGGGFDLTPIYGFEEDAAHWHRTAAEACAPFGEGVYDECKAWCDRYFHIPHRREARGVGGLFFDDWKRDGFRKSFAFVQSVGDHFLPAYEPIVARRFKLTYGEREREFQLYRRGRYAEFNLVYDRGTRYGLQSGKRTETVMASMPPAVQWPYKYVAESGSEEERLALDFLKPRDWLAWSSDSD